MDIHKVKAGANREVANSKLFDIMVDMIGSDALLNTLAIRYPDQGHEAMEYIQSFWASSTNDHKAEKTYDDYEELQQKNTHQSRTGIRLELLMDRHYRPSRRTRHHLTVWGGVNFSPLVLHLILWSRARGKRAREGGGGWVGGLKVGVTPHPFIYFLS